MSQYLDRINRTLSRDVRDGYTYFGPWVIAGAEITDVRQDAGGIAYYRVLVTLTDHRSWTIERRYSDFYNSMKWLEIYDKHHHLPCDISFPPKDNNSVLLSYRKLSPEAINKRKADLNTWLQSRVRFCCNSHARVVVRIQSELNYLLDTGAQLQQLHKSPYCRTEQGFITPASAPQAQESIQYPVYYIAQPAETRMHPPYYPPQPSQAIPSPLHQNQEFQPSAPPANGSTSTCSYADMHIMQHGENYVTTPFDSHQPSAPIYAEEESGGADDRLPIAVPVSNEHISATTRLQEEPS